MKGLGFLLLKYSVYERVGKSVVLVENTCKAQKSKQMLFTAVKKLRKCSGFVIYLRHISKVVNLQQSKGTRYLKGVPLLSIADIQNGVHCTCIRS